MHYKSKCKKPYKLQPLDLRHTQILTSMVGSMIEAYVQTESFVIAMEMFMSSFCPNVLQLNVP